jgi:hypothetical protein
VETLQTLLLLFFGVGIFIYVSQAWKAGEIRMGSKGFSEYTPSRDKQPFVFYFGILF